MTPRARHIETLLFGRPDRIPFMPGEPREKTLARWYGEGLPRAGDWFDHLCAAVGITRERPAGPTVQPEVNFGMAPTFDEQVLEHRDGHYLVRDWMGNVVEISDEYDYTYIRSPKDFVTRKWHKFPVANRDDFERMKVRFNPDGPARYPADFAERVRVMKSRDYVTSLAFAGPFWQMREWCGFEPLCTMFLEDPEFVREMTAFHTEFVSRTMARALDSGVVDQILVSEDMAFKERSMISPEMARAFLLPAWSRWLNEARQAGVPLFDMDSDGRVDALIPVWLEAGFNVCDPLEVAAGCDIVAYRRTFSRRIAYRQGIDKRAIAAGGKTIEQELARVAPVVKDGGYIPGCDHGVPYDISWPDFIRYARLLAELAGWL